MAVLILAPLLYLVTLQFLLLIHTPASSSRVVPINTFPSATPITPFKTQLIHRDSVASPFHNSSATLRERFRHSWRRSIDRSTQVRHAMKRKHKKEMLVSRIAAADYGTGAEYLMSFSVGTPAQTFVAVADTGSSLVWLQCSPCHRCTDPHGVIFQPDMSSTYKNVPCNNTLCQLLNQIDVADTTPNLQQCSDTCQFQYLYGDLSNALGTLSVENVNLERIDSGWQTVQNFVFGCAHQSENDFFTSGLVGLGPRPYSFTSQLGSVLGHKFSYCLVGLDEAVNKTSDMSFGETEDTAISGMRYTPLLNARNNMSSYYYVSLKGISLGGKRLDIPHDTFDFNLETSGGTILDSGTTFMMLAEPAYNAVLRALRSMVSYERENIASGEYEGLWCYNISGVKNPVFPSFTLHLDKVDLVLPHANTFVKMSRSAVCLAVSSSGSMFADDLNITIIGNIAQQNFHVQFDVQNERVGFTPRSCGERKH